MRFLHRARPTLSTMPPWRTEWDQLASYNAERARGIVHTVEWRVAMARLQADFDNAQQPDGYFDTGSDSIASPSIARSS